MAKTRIGKTTLAVKNEDTFFSDLTVPGMLYAVLIRSPVRHGFLLDVKPPKLPDGYALYTALDIPGINNSTIRNMKIPIFASYEILFKGEPVGILTGPDFRMVEQLAKEVEVDIEEKEPISFQETFSPVQVLTKKIVSHDFIDDALVATEDENRTVFESVYTTESYKPFYAEPQGALVTTKEGKLDIYTAAQWPFQVRDCVAQMLDIPESFITVHSTNTGEHLDSKLWYPIVISAQVALASYIEGKPVKLVYSREEEDQFAPMTPATHITHRTTVDLFGKILSMDIRILIDCGAYCPLIEELVERMVLSATGIYDIEQFKIEAYAIKSNNSPKGACFGWGDAETFFAIENHTSYLAKELNIMPAEFKILNTIDNEKKLVTGTVIKGQVPILDLFSAVMNESDFARKQIAYEYMANHRENLSDGPLKGIGIACAYQGSGFLEKNGSKESYTVEAIMEKDGSVNLRMSQFSASMEKIWKKTAADILEIDEKFVSVCKTDTATGSKSGPSTLSVNVTIMRRLVERCCTAISKQRFRNPLPIQVKRTYRNTQNWDSETFTGNPYSDISWAAAVVEVTVDPLRFNATIKNIWIAVDAGKIYSPEAVDRGLSKSVYDALSKTLLPTDGLYNITASLEYQDYPEPHIILLPSKADSKGIGSLPLNVIPAAYTTALSQALKLQCNSLPVTNAMLLKGLSRS